MRFDNDPIPGRDDLEELGIAPGFAEIPMPVDPRDFIRPDGSYSVTPLNAPDSAAVDAVNAHKRRLREATPISSTFPNHDGEEL